MRIPPLRIKIALGSNPLKSTMSVGRLGVVIASGRDNTIVVIIIIICIITTIIAITTILTTTIWISRVIIIIIYIYIHTIVVLSYCSSIVV